MIQHSDLKCQFYFENMFKYGVFLIITLITPVFYNEPDDRGCVRTLTAREAINHTGFSIKRYGFFPTRGADLQGFI